MFDFSEQERWLSEWKGKTLEQVKRENDYPLSRPMFVTVRDIADGDSIDELLLAESHRFPPKLKVYPPYTSAEAHLAERGIATCLGRSDVSAQDWGKVFEVARASKLSRAMSFKRVVLDDGLPLILIGKPDGVGDDFVYEFKCTSRYDGDVRLEWMIQAQLYALIFDKRDYVIDVLIHDQGYEEERYERRFEMVEEEAYRSLARVACAARVPKKVVRTQWSFEVLREKAIRSVSRCHSTFSSWCGGVAFPNRKARKAAADKLRSEFTPSMTESHMHRVWEEEYLRVDGDAEYSGAPWMSVGRDIWFHLKDDGKEFIEGGLRIERTRRAESIEEIRLIGLERDHEAIDLQELDFDLETHCGDYRGPHSKPLTIDWTKEREVLLRLEDPFEVMTGEQWRESWEDVCILVSPGICPVRTHWALRRGNHARLP